MKDSMTILQPILASSDHHQKMSNLKPNRSRFMINDILAGSAAAAAAVEAANAATVAAAAAFYKQQQNNNNNNNNINNNHINTNNKNINNNNCDDNSTSAQQLPIPPPPPITQIPLPHAALSVGQALTTTPATGLGNIMVGHHATPPTTHLIGSHQQQHHNHHHHNNHHALTHKLPFPVGATQIGSNGLNVAQYAAAMQQHYANAAAARHAAERHTVELDDSSDYQEDNEDCGSDPGSGHLDDNSVCSNGEVRFNLLMGGTGMGIGRGLFEGSYRIEKCTLQLL